MGSPVEDFLKTVGVRLEQTPRSASSTSARLTAQSGGMGKGGVNSRDFSLSSSLAHERRGA